MPVKRYKVRQPNGTVSTLKLNDSDAKRLGVFEEPKKAETKKRTPANKSRTPKSKG